MDDAMNCKETFQRLNDYVDRELAEGEHELVEAHLAACTQCAALFDFEGNMLRELREKLNRIRLPDTLRARVAEALERGTRAADS